MGDMYRGVVFLHLACSVNPLWPSGTCPEACYPVFTSWEQPGLIRPLRLHPVLSGDPTAWLS